MIRSLNAFFQCGPWNPDIAVIFHINVISGGAGTRKLSASLVPDFDQEPLEVGFWLLI
jgi:hypothetical protein